MSKQVGAISVRVDVITGTEGLSGLEREWNELLDDSSATVFQSFEWISSWWKYFGAGDTLHVLCFRDNERLLGIAPFSRERVRLLGIPLAFRLQFVGHHLADYGDCIVRKGYEEDVVDALVNYLRSNNAAWDICDLEDLNETSEIVRRLPAKLDPAQIGLSTYQGSVCPQRPLPKTWDEFVQSIGPNLRNNLRRKQKKLDELFATEFEVFRDDASGLEDAVNSFATIHGDRWKSLGFPSAFDDPHHREFHLEIARRFATRGWLRLSFITANRQRVAVSFDFHFRRRIYMYQCNAAGPDDVMRQSPGMLIKAASIRAGIADGMEMYDFLRGDEPYKLSEWKSVNSKNYLFRLVNMSSHGSLRLRLFVVWELLQKAVLRGKREYYELRKFTLTRDASLEEQVNFIFARIGVLLNLAAGYLSRNLGTRTTDNAGKPGTGGSGEDRHG